MTLGEGHYLTLFRYLVKNVMSYGVEIWGWEEKKELEKIWMDYVKWIFKLDFCIPRFNNKGVRIEKDGV